MTRAPSPAQRTRRLLNQAVMQRSHRRGELIRVIEEIEPSLNPDHAAEQTSADQRLSDLLEKR